jgi:hypothetical protein
MHWVYWSVMMVVGFVACAFILVNALRGNDTYRPPVLGDVTIEQCEPSVSAARYCYGTFRSRDGQLEYPHVRVDTTNQPGERAAAWVDPDEPGVGHFHHPGGSSTRDEQIYAGLLGVVIFPVAFALYVRRARITWRAWSSSP